MNKPIVYLGKVSRIIMGQSPSSSSYSEEKKGLPFLQGCAEFGDKHPTPVKYCSTPLKVAPKGSVLVSVRAPVGDINIADQDYIIGRGLSAILATGINQDLLPYLLDFVKPQLRRVAQGSTFEAISFDDLDRCQLPDLGNEKEQAKIAEVLVTIDRAIAQTEALITKHQLIKTGLMQDLLTCGMDEHGQLRDPSTHRFKSTPLGMIPEEWEVSNIGKISHRVTSGSRWWARYYSETGAKFIRIGNLTREHVNLRLQNIQHVQPPDSSEAKRTVLETGDLLISVTADLGIIGIVPNDLDEAYINQHIALVKLDKEKINPYFIGNLLSGFQAQKYFSLLNDSGAKAGLNLKTISAFPVVFPSDKKEQDRIAEIIQKTDDIIEKQKSERKKLLGVKAGLMQDLLSGRVSVKVLMK